MKDIQHNIDLLTIKKYALLCGKSESAIRHKIEDKKWIEGIEYFRDPDGNLWVSIIGAESWVRKGRIHSPIKSDMPTAATALRSISRSKIDKRTSRMSCSGDPPILI